MKTKRFKSLSFKLTAWYMVILATLITLTGFFLYDRFAQSLTNDLETKLARIANTTLRFWLKKGVTWQNAIDKAEIEFKMCQPFIQVIKLPDQKEQKTWAFFHSSNITGTSFQMEKELYLRAKILQWIPIRYPSHRYEPSHTWPDVMWLFRWDYQWRIPSTPRDDSLSFLFWEARCYLF